MSEIFFEISETENLEKKYKEISDSINLNGFSNTALKYSISETSNIGGSLDWINENSLNQKIKTIISSKKINDFTKPITVPGGFLILKLNDIKMLKYEKDLEFELKKIIKESENSQLNQFSKIYFNKVKKNMQINEI